jgi:hypothetical protein
MLEVRCSAVHSKVFDKYWIMWYILDILASFISPNRINSRKISRRRIRSVMRVV